MRSIINTYARSVPMLGILGIGVGLVSMVTAAYAQPSGTTLGAPTGDVMRGWRLFHDKRCVECHAIWDQGSRVGPDLGRIRLTRLSDGQLAGVMWNHIPKMLGRMRQTGRRPTNLTREEMGDLFALIFFARQLDEPGNPILGEGILRAKGCSECHETGGFGEGVGPDLAKWASYANPVSWAQMMWEHAPVMEEAMARTGMTWPKLEGTDLIHIVAYIRSTGAGGDKTYLRPGSVENGRELFQKKQCDTCHPGSGPDLATADLPSSVGALASRMWNHSPAMMRVMRERGLARQPVSAQELADIVAYALALGNRDRGGDVTRGERLFTDKGCVQCHDRDETREAGGPSIGELGLHAMPVAMATAMWNHGESMLERMTEAGLAWPVFHDTEMSDLLAYLKLVEAESGAEGGPENR